MRWPSEVLHDLAGRVDEWEDSLHGIYQQARSHISGYKVWEWRYQQERLEQTRTRNRMLVAEYKKLRDKYQEDTGKQYRTSFVVLAADEDGMDRFRKSLERMRRVLGGYSR